MKISKRINVYLASIFLILILWPWGRLAESKESINNPKKLADSKAERTGKNLQTELFLLSNMHRSGASQKNSQSDVNIKPVEQKLVIINSEEINASVDIMCADTKGAIANDKTLMQKKERQRNIESRFDRKRLNRQKRDSQPMGTSSATPEGSPERKPEGTPEGSSAEPQATTEPIADPEQSWPEPNPDWPDALAKWKDAWPVHTYGFAAVFTVIAMIPPFELVRMHVGKVRISPLKSTLLVIIFIFSSTRAITLFVDPYGTSKRFPFIVTQLLFSLGHPCIISALSLLLLVLTDTTKMNIAPPRFQRVKFIIPVVISHVALVILTDFIVAYLFEAKALLLMCQIYFLLLGSLLAIGYIRVGWKIHTNIKANVNSKSSVDNSMRRLQYLIIACAVISAFISVLTVYAAAGVFGVYSDVQYVEAWPWWIFQTLNRLLETAFCIVVLLMNTRTTRRKILPSFVTASVLRSRRNTKIKQIAAPAAINVCQSIESVGG